MRKLVIFLAFIPTICFAQQEVLNSFFSRLESSTLKAQFTITVSDGSSQPMHFNGQITMHGDKFNLQMGDLEVSYDGTTLYHYDEGLDELTLSTPTLQEITESNPLIYAKAVAELCSVRYPAKKSDNNYLIELIPNDASVEASSFTICLTKDELLPVSVVIKENINSYTSLELRQAEYTTDSPSFVLKKDGAEINDLR